MHTVYSSNELLIFKYPLISWTFDTSYWHRSPMDSKGQNRFCYISRTATTRHQNLCRLNLPQFSNLYKSTKYSFPNHMYKLCTAMCMCFHMQDKCALQLSPFKRSIKAAVSCIPWRHIGNRSLGTELGLS